MDFYLILTLIIIALLGLSILGISLEIVESKKMIDFQAPAPVKTQC